MKKVCTSIFFCFYFFMIALMPILILGMISGIVVICQSGFSGTNDGFTFFCVEAMFVGMSMVVPSLKTIYQKYPWLYHYCMILLSDIFILSISEWIMNYGYQVVDPKRHTLFMVLAIIQFIVCRIMMGYYFKKHSYKEDWEAYYESEV